MPKFTVENIEVKTATVEIRMIVVDGKHISQAMFRQFPERELIAENGALNGIPWGWVNYHPEKCTDEPHLHVLWSLDKGIFRSTVALDVVHPRRIDLDTATAWVDAKVREDATGVLAGWQPTPDETTKPFHGVSVHMVMSSEAHSVTHARKELEEARRTVDEHGPAHLVKVARPRSEWGGPPSGLSAARAAARAANRFQDVPASEVLRTAEDAFEKALAALPTTPLVEAEARLIAEVHVEVDRRRRHREVRQTLAEMQQLFISK